MKSVDDEEERPIAVVLRCPDCGHDFSPDGPVDRHKVYECPKCTYEFSLGGTLQ